jgi:hypothetical protein
MVKQSIKITMIYLRIVCYILLDAKHLSLGLQFSNAIHTLTVIYKLHGYTKNEDQCMIYLFIVIC